MKHIQKVDSQNGKDKKESRDKNAKSDKKANLSSQSCVPAGLPPEY